MPDGAHVSVRGEAECGSAAVEIACVAGVYDKAAPILSCSPDTLSRLIAVAAWYALEHAAEPGEDYEAFRLRHPSRLGLTAFQSSGSTDGTWPYAKGLASLRSESELVAPNVTRTSVGGIFDSILALTFAAIIGHESSHLETTPPFCAIEQRSRLEEMGTWDVLFRVETSGELFEAGNPVKEEVVADRCALRRIRLASAAIDAGPLDEPEKAFARRAAADITSTLLLLRIGPGASLRAIAVGDSYLYPALRIAALAGEMGIGAAGPAICGGAAENLTQATQTAMQQRPGKGLMPDGMENLFPRGVIDAWEHRGNWSQKSFSCSP